MTIAARNAAIIKLAMAKVVPSEIAARMNVGVFVVYGVISKARKDGHDIPRFKGGASSPKGRVVRVPQDVYESLENAAAARDVKPGDLAREILATVIDDNLLEAVLDA